MPRLTAFMGLPDVPPAFRRRKQLPASYVGMTDDQVVKVAASSLRMVQMLPVGSRTRADQWASFDSAMGELGSRAIVHVLAKIHEKELAEGDGGPGDTG